jgi:hypothetical protein
MLDKKLTTCCALLLTATALGACGSDEDSTSSVPLPSAQKQMGQAPELSSQSRSADAPQAQEQKRDRKNRIADEPGDDTASKTPAAKRRSQKTSADNSRKKPTCSQDPDSRQCEDERRPPAQEDPRGTQLHGDKPPAKSSGCGGKVGCGGSDEPDH